jgi:hypothetical protein
MRCVADQQQARPAPVLDMVGDGAEQTLSDDGWKAREPLVRNFARLPLPAFGGASPDEGVISGPFMEYIRQVREEEGAPTPG